jgi:hypothetical protein
MIDQLRTKLLYRKISCIEITGDIKSLYKVKVINASFKRGNLKVDSYNQFNSLEQLVNFIDIKIPLIVLFNGKQVVHKLCNINDNNNDDITLNTLFPNFSNDDFIYQKNHISISSVYYSIVRKELLDEIVKIIETKGYIVVSTAIGPFCLGSIREYITNFSSLHISDYLVKLSNGVIISIEYKSGDVEERLVIDDEIVSSNYILIYSCIISFLIGSKYVNKHILVDSYNKYKYKTYLKYLIYSSLFFIFIILIINSIIYYRYGKLLEDVSQEYTLKKEKIIEIDSLIFENKRKQEYLVKNNFIELSRTSFYIDRLSRVKPNEIRYIDFNIFPVLKDASIDNNEDYSFDCELITISGIANSTIVLDEWLGRIKNEPWVKSVSLDKIKQVENPNFTYFTININLR